MEVKKAPRIPFTEKQWTDYKEKLAIALADHAMSCDEVAADSAAKVYIDNYMKSELLNPKMETRRLLTNTNIRLAHVDIETKEGLRVYPIINEYIGHHIKKTIYFSKVKDEVVIGCVEVNPSSILIP